jgi:Uma2 family endonuclease
MAKERSSKEQRIVLAGVSWQKYETLLAEMAEQRTARFTYDHGRLEMMTPLDEHERCHKLIESLILVLADVMQIQVDGYKTPILKRLDLGVATEPDAGYYIQNVAQIGKKTTIDLSIDPPPDLILEVSLTKTTVNKLPIYLALGIPEVWRYSSKPGTDFFRGSLIIYGLEGETYMESGSSLAFPFLTAARILQFIDQSDTLGLMTGLRSLREWVQQHC